MMGTSLHNLLFAIISGFLLIITLFLSLNQLTLKANSTHKEVLSDAYHLLMIPQNTLVEVAPIFAG